MTSKKAPQVPYPLMLIVGVGLMFAGFYVSKNVKIEFLETLAKQGIFIDLGKTVAVIGVFLIVFPLINTFYLKPLQEAIDDRNNALERTFTEAEELRAEMTQMRSDYESQLARTEADAREKIQAQIREAQVLRQQMLAEAGALKEEMVQRAGEEIQREKEKVMQSVRLEVVGLTLGATEKLLGTNVDSDTNRRLIQEFIDKAEVPKV